MIRLLTDENFNQKILRGLIRRIPHLDFVLVNEVGLASLPDRVLLRWAAREHRIIVSQDVKTMGPEAEQRIRHGEPMAGLIVVPQSVPIGDAINDLELLVECYSESDMRDTIKRLPL